MIKGIGNISNYYGGLNVKESDGKYYWCIEDWDGLDSSNWNEIPKQVYNCLIKYQKQLDKEEKQKN